MDALDLQQALQRLRFAFERASNQPMSEKFGFGCSHFRLLVSVAHHAGASQAEVARELGQTEAAVSRQIKFLLDQGLVKTSTNPRNRRQHLLSTTPAGQRQLMSAKTFMKKHFHQLVGGVDSSLIKQTVGVLESLADQLESSAQK